MRKQKNPERSEGWQAHLIPMHLELGSFCKCGEQLASGPRDRKNPERSKGWQPHPFPCT
jgi:hypothetical protein